MLDAACRELVSNMVFNSQVVHGCTRMPGLKEDLSPFLMDCICYFSPGLGVVLGDHEGCVFPVTASPIDKSAFIDNKPDTISSSISVVLNLRWARLVAVYAAVPGHRTHDYAISQ